jgi:hypothetical protein
VVPVESTQRLVHRLRHDLVTAHREAEQLRYDVTRLKTHLVDEQARLRRHLAKTRQQRDELAELLATPKPAQASTADYYAAQAALIAAWPDLAADPVYVEALVNVALAAAWQVHHKARTEDQEPAQLEEAVTTPKPATVRHASPHCACGINDAGTRYVDPICQP